MPSPQSGPSGTSQHRNTLRSTVIDRRKNLAGKLACTSFEKDGDGIVDAIADEAAQIQRFFEGRHAVSCPLPRLLLSLLLNSGAIAPYLFTGAIKLR